MMVNGEKYTGEYVQGKKQGQGVYEWSNGTRYEGGWLNNKQHGEGKLIYKDGEVK